jgi:hypothetical protein
MHDVTKPPLTRRPLGLAAIEVLSAATSASPSAVKVAYRSAGQLAGAVKRQPREGVPEQA